MISVAADSIGSQSFGSVDDEIGGDVVLTVKPTWELRHKVRTIYDPRVT